MIPQTIIAGDPTQFAWSSSTHPSDAWSLTFYLNGATSIAVTGTGNDDGSFTVLIPALQSGQLTGGVYSYAMRTTKGNLTYTVATGTLMVKDNPATATSKAVLAQRMITLVERCLEGQLSSGEAVESLSIGGRSLSLMSREELLKERSYWYRELERYRNSGTGTIRQIIVNPSRL